MAQYARPDSDIAAGNWTPNSGSTLYTQIDEVSASDSDFIQASSTETTATIGLSNVSDPGVSSGHVVRYRAQKTTTPSGSLTVRLFQGSTEIANQTPTLTTSWVLYTFTLSDAQANSITDYSDLRLQFTGSSNNASRFVNVSWAEFEVPDTVTPVTITAGAAGVVCSARNTVVQSSISLTFDVADAPTQVLGSLVVPGAVVVVSDVFDLGTSALSAIIKTVSAVDIPVFLANLTSVAPGLIVTPGEIKLSVNSSLLTAAGNISLVIPGQMFVLLDSGLTSVSGVAYDVLPGVVSTLAESALISSIGDNVAIISGAALIGLSRADVAIQISPAVVLSSVSVIVNDVLLNSVGVASSISTAFIIGANLISISITSQNFVIDPGWVSIQFDPAYFTALGGSLLVVPGAASVLFGTPYLVTSGQSANILSQVLITSHLASMSFSSEPLYIAASANVDLNTCQLIAYANTIDVFGVLGVLVDAAAINIIKPQADILPGVISTVVSPGEIALSGLSLFIGSTVSIQVNPGNTTLSGYLLSVIPGWTTILVSCGNVSVTAFLVDVISGGASILFHPANAIVDPQVALVVGANLIVLNFAELSVTGLISSASSGATIVVLSIGSITLAIPTFSILPGNVVSIFNVGLLEVTPGFFSIVPGVVIAHAYTPYLQVTGEIIYTLPGGYTVSSYPGQLELHPEKLVITPGGVTITQSTGDITLFPIPASIYNFFEILLNAAGVQATLPALHISPGSVVVPATTSNIGLVSGVLYISPGSVFLIVDYTYVQVAFDNAEVLSLVRILANNALIGSLANAGMVIPGGVSLGVSPADMLAAFEILDIYVGTLGVLLAWIMYINAASQLANHVVISSQDESFIHTSHNDELFIASEKDNNLFVSMGYNEEVIV